MGNVRASTSNLNRVCQQVVLWGHVWPLLAHIQRPRHLSAWCEKAAKKMAHKCKVCSLHFSTALRALAAKTLALRCRAPNHSSLTPDSKQCWTRTQIPQVKFSWPGFTNTAFLLYSISKQTNRPSYVVSRALSILLPSHLFLTTVWIHRSPPRRLLTVLVAQTCCVFHRSWWQENGCKGCHSGRLARYETPQVLCGNTCARSG